MYNIREGASFLPLFVRMLLCCCHERDCVVVMRGTVLLCCCHERDCFVVMRGLCCCHERVVLLSLEGLFCCVVVMRGTVLLCCCHERDCVVVMRGTLVTRQYGIQNMETPSEDNQHDTFCTNTGVLMLHSLHSLHYC